MGESASLDLRRSSLCEESSPRRSEHVECIRCRHIEHRIRSGVEVAAVLLGLQIKHRFPAADDASGGGVINIEAKPSPVPGPVV